MHCQYIGGAHARGSTGALLHPAANESCSIHTLLTLLSGVWVPWLPGSEPTTQQRAQAIRTDAESAEGRFVTEQLAKGVRLDLWEQISPEQVSDFEQCTVIEAGFAALVGKLHLSEPEKVVVNDDFSSVDVPAINAAAEARATACWDQLHTRPSGGDCARRATKADFARTWTAQGGGDKHRFYVVHNKILNRGCPAWAMSFPTAHSAPRRPNLATSLSPETTNPAILRSRYARTSADTSVSTTQ